MSLNSADIERVTVRTVEAAPNDPSNNGNQNDISNLINSISTNLVIVSLVVSLWIFKKVLQPFLDKVHLRLSYSWVEESRVDSILSQIMGITRADRVILFEFHNGEISKGGRHLNKMTATKEVTSAGVTKISHQLQGHSIGIYSRVLDTLLKDKIIKTDVKALEEGTCKNQFIKNGVEFCITRMQSLQETPISIVQIQYCKSQREDYDSFNAANLSDLVSELDAIVCKDRAGVLKLVLESLMK